MRTKRKYAIPKINILICLVCAALVAVLDAVAVWIGDEIIYSFVCLSDKPISNLGDIFLSQYIHYLNVNGRYVAHWLVQFMLGIGGRTLFVILNSLVYIVFIWLVARYAGVSLRRWPLALIIATACIAGFQTKFVPSCQIGYMWMFTLVLAVLTVFFSKSWPKWWLWWLVPLCLLAGEGQEALNVGVCGALFIYVLQRRARLSGSQWAMLVAFFIGAAFLVLSPGSHSRLDNMQGISFLQSLPFSVFVMLTEMRLTWLLVVVLAIALWKRKTTWRDFYRDNSFEIHVFLICLAMNYYIHIYCNRQMFGMELMALIITLRLLKAVANKRLEIVVGVLLAFLVVYIGVTGYNTATRRAAIYDNIQKLYEESNTGIIFMDISDKDSEIDDFDPCDAFDYNRQMLFKNYFRYRAHDNNKQLLLLPTALKKKPEGNLVYRMSPDGRIYVVCFDKRFVVKRSLHIFGKRIPISDYCPNENAAIYGDDEFKIYLIETGNGMSHATKEIIFNDSVEFVSEVKR